MPYITLKRRLELDPGIEELQEALLGLGNEEGDLNYVITRLIGSWFINLTRYSTIAQIFGVLMTVGLEFYRRICDHYEDQAIKKNGDVQEYEEILKRLKMKSY